MQRDGDDGPQSRSLLRRALAPVGMLQLLLAQSMQPACAAGAEWPSRPVSPNRDPQLDVEAFGAVADNRTDNKHAIAKALAACAASHGCTLTFPGPGIYVSGPIALVSNLTLVVAEGATLHGARSTAGWPVLPWPEWPSKPNGNSPVGGGQLGPYMEPNGSFVGWFRGYNVSDVTVTGGGTLDGGGSLWRNLCARGANQCPALPQRPYMLHFEGMERVHLSNLRVQNSGFWTVHFQYSAEILIEKLSVYNPAGGNADGIDIDSSRNALVRESTWDVGDDMLCVKSGKTWAAWGPTNRSKADEMPIVRVPSENILFIDNECRAGGGKYFPPHPPFDFVVRARACVCVSVCLCACVPVCLLGVQLSAKS